MLKIAICDDNPFSRDEIKQQVSDWAELKGINCRIMTFSSGEDLLMNIEMFGGYDILFQDIELGGISGLTAAQCVKEMDYSTGLIFISQYDSFYQDGYEMQPFHFLQKPLPDGKLRRVLDKYLEYSHGLTESFSFSRSKTFYSMELADIIYFSSEKRQINIIGKDESNYFYGKLDDLEDSLGDRNHKFIRIHQSHLVNVRHIRKYHNKCLLLSNGDELVVSGEYKKAVSKLHMLMLENVE